MKYQKRILVVNDEAEMLNQIKRWLLISGYVVRCTMSAEKGIELFHKNNFDLVLLDYNLEKEKAGSKTAKTFIPMFKKINPIVPIVIISATETQLKKEELGVEDVFVVKSALWRNLPTIVQHVLDTKA